MRQLKNRAGCYIFRVIVLQYRSRKSNKLVVVIPLAADKSSRSRKLKHDVIEAVNELIQDITTCHEQIAEQAIEHIHQKYVLVSAA